MHSYVFTVVHSPHSPLPAPLRQSQSSYAPMPIPVQQSHCSHAFFSIPLQQSYSPHDTLPIPSITAVLLLGPISYNSPTLVTILCPSLYSSPSDQTLFISSLYKSAFSTLAFACPLTALSRHAPMSIQLQQLHSQYSPLLIPRQRSHSPPPHLTVPSIQQPALRYLLYHPLAFLCYSINCDPVHRRFYSILPLCVQTYHTRTATPFLTYAFPFPSTDIPGKLDIYFRVPPPRCLYVHTILYPSLYTLSGLSIPAPISSLYTIPKRLLNISMC
jgi:hypothetical protein